MGRVARKTCGPMKAAARTIFVGSALGVSAVTVNTASAGPWSQGQGHVYAEVAVLGQRIDGAGAVRGELYAEYGVTDRWTIIGQAEGVQFPQLSGQDQYAYRATARRQIWQKGRFTAAFEGGVVGGAAIGGTIGGCDSAGGEARLSVGVTGRTKRKEREWFAFADVIAREHGNCRRQRLEAGFGQEIFPKWWSVSKVYLETGSGDARSIKLDSKISRTFGRNELGLGYRQEVSGRFQEIGLLVSLVRRF